jgi:hypothetical protein
MRKRILTKQVAVMLSVEMYQNIIEATDRAEISISQFVMLQNNTRSP